MAGRGAASSAMRPGDLTVIALGATVFLLSLGALAAVGLASLLFGGGWVWPSGVAGAAREVGAVISGHPSHGFDAVTARRVPGGAAVWTVLVIVETVAVAVALMLSRALVPVRSSGDRTGFASRADADAWLGRGQLPRTGLTGQGRGRQWPPWQHWREWLPAWPGRPGRSSAPAAGWLLGKSQHARGVRLWVPFGRMAAVVGSSRADEARDVLAQADLAAPGALLRVCADPEDLLLTLTRRSSGGRPVAVCDPYGLLPGVTPLVWDPLAGCVDSTLATRRAGAFTAATVLAAASSGGDPVAARFHAAEAAKVLQGYFHAAALTGRTLDHVMGWVADPYGDETAAKILTEHPHAESHWAGLLRGVLRGSANTVALVQQAMRPFMHREVSRRCLPNYRQPATDIADLLSRGGTIYLLGKDDAYNSVSPLFTAIAEDVLDIAERADLAGTGALMVTLDNLPSTTPIPTLPQRLARGTRRGVSIVWVAANWQQLITCYGEGDARGVRRSTDVLVLLDGDAPEWVKAPAWASPAEPGQAVVLMATSPPIMTRIRRASADAAVRADVERARAELAGHGARWAWRRDRSVAALTAARDHGLHADSKGFVTYRNFGDAGPETRI